MNASISRCDSSSALRSGGETGCHAKESRSRCAIPPALHSCLASVDLPDPEFPNITIFFNSFTRMRPYRSQGNVQCESAKCQVALWSYYPVFHDKVRFVRVGTLDEPDRLPPDVHIYTSSKQRWFELPANALAVDEYYITEDVWREKSLERRQALMEGC